MFFLVAAVAMLAMYSCKDYDDSANPYHRIAEITVDSTSVIFEAAPSTGFITVNAPKGITNVSSSAAWCTATASGSVVNISATQNDNLEGRSSQITIWSGADSTQVTVQQHGFLFQLDTGTADNSITTDDNAKRMAFYMKHNTEISVSTSADWLTPVVDGDTLRFTVAVNATGNPRGTYVYYSSGTMRDSIEVTQFEIGKDVLGDYSLVYYDSDDEQHSYATNLYRRADGTYGLRFTSGSYGRNGFEIPVELGTGYPSVIMTNMDSIGMYTYRDVEYQVRLLTMYSRGTSHRRSDDTGLKAYGYWFVDDGGHYYSFEMSNGAEFYALRLGLSPDGSYDGISRTLNTLYYAELQKVTGGNGAKPASQAERLPAIRRLRQVLGR